jgi:hypothetical protein
MKNKLLSIFFFIFVFIVFANAQTPPNDLCIDAIEVFCGDSINGNTSNATTSGNPAYCGTSITTQGVWYKFTGNGEFIVADLCSNYAFDNKLTVYKGSCSNLVCVTGNDDFCGLGAKVQFQSTPNTVYYFFVSGFGSANGNFTLTLRCFDFSLPPTNNNCINALPIICYQNIFGYTSNGVPIDSTLFGSICGTVNNSGKGVWYSAIGTGNPINLYVYPTDTLNCQLSLYTNTCDSLVCVDGFDDTISNTSWITFQSNIGQSYFIFVSGANNTYGSFYLQFGCFQTTDIYISDKEKALILYPNPVSNVLKINCKKNGLEQILVHNLFGECVFKSYINNSTSEVSIDVSTFTNGIYFIEAVTNKGIMRQKFIKE